MFFGDSWSYLNLAFEGDPVASRPTGRAATRSLIDLLSVFGRSLAAITVAQHLAGS